jgi:hypothetical protein
LIQMPSCYWCPAWFFSMVDFLEIFVPIIKLVLLFSLCIYRNTIIYFLPRKKTILRHCLHK